MERYIILSPTTITWTDKDYAEKIKISNAEVVRILNEQEEKEIEEQLKELEIIKGLVGEKTPDIQTGTSTGKLPVQFDKKEFAWIWCKRIIAAYLADQMKTTEKHLTIEELFEKEWKEQEK